MARVPLKKLFFALNSVLALYFLFFFGFFAQKPPKTNSRDFSPELSQIETFVRNCSLRGPAHNSSLLFCDSALSLLEEPLIGRFECRPLRLLVVVFNRVDDFTRRKTIRSTWKRAVEAEHALAARVLFAVGRARDEHVDALVREESRVFADILQFAFFDAYFNCTLKALAVTRFAATRCPRVRHVLKVDDDAFVRAGALARALPFKSRDAIHGHVWRSARVQRSSDQKWRIGERDYSEGAYPDYVGGPYLLPGRFTQALYSAALRMLPKGWLPFEDVFLTGIVAQHVSVARVHMNEVLYTPWLGACALKRLDLCYYDESAILWQNLSDEDLLALNRSEALLTASGRNCRHGAVGRALISLRMLLGGACVTT